MGELRGTLPHRSRSQSPHLRKQGWDELAQRHSFATKLTMQDTDDQVVNSGEMTTRRCGSLTQLGPEDLSTHTGWGTVYSGLGSAREVLSRGLSQTVVDLYKRESTVDTREIYAPKGSKSHGRIPDN